MTPAAKLSRFRRVLVVLLLALATCAQAQPAVPLELQALEGIWASETQLTPVTGGPLSVVRKGQSWRARLLGEDVSFVPVKGQLRFAFKGHPGGFRGQMARDGRSLQGFWLQASGAPPDGSDQVATRQPFATPLVLQRQAAGTWRGNVQPLVPRFALYLKVFRHADGAWVAVFRNPDINSNGGAALFRAAVEGGKLVLSARPDEAKPEVRHELTLSAATPNAATPSLQLFWPDVGQTLTLTHRTPEQAAGFFARVPGSVYTYQPPVGTGDGWPTTRATAAGLDEATLAQVVQKIADSDPLARRPVQIHALLVARHGRLVLEEYFHGYSREQPHDLRSAAKTFASVLLGVAMRQGAPITPDSKAYALLAGLGPFANPDPRKAQITVGQLLTHTSGLACNDNDDDSPGNEDGMQSQQGQPDWRKFTLDLPMAHEPGSRYAYCSASINLGGAAVSAATGTWLPALFDKTVAQPLQFGPYYWNLMPNGEGYQGGGVFMRPRDLLKIGQLYLNGGTWQGRRVVTADWVKQSTAPRVHIGPASTGLAPEQFGNFYVEADDGYAWHLNQLRTHTERRYSDYEATGNGGQLLMVLPALDMVVVMTGGNYNQGGVWNRWRHEIVGQGITAAVRP